VAQARLEIILSALDMASDELKQVEKELGDINKAGQKTSTTASQIKAGWQSMLGTVGALTAGLFAVKKGFDFAEEGAQLLLVEERFNRLAESIGTTGAALMSDLGPAMGGMLSKAEMMTAATDLMALGLVKTHDEAIRLAAVAGQLNMNMNQLVLTLTNQTTMRFDALGVSVDGFDEKVQALKASGMSASDAFGEAFLQQAEEQLERVGSAAETTAGEFAKLRANIKDMADEAKTGLAGFIAPLVSAINAEEELKDAVDLGIITREESIELINKATWTNYTFADALQYVADKEKQLSYDTVGADKALLNHTTSLSQTSEGYQEVSREAGRAIDYIRGVHDELQSAATAEVRLFEFVTPDIGASIAGTLEQLDWMLQTGGQIESKVQEITAQWRAGQITSEEYQSGLRDTYAITQDVMAEMGQLTDREAAKNIAEQLNIPLREARELVGGSEGISEALIGLNEITFDDAKEAMSSYYIDGLMPAEEAVDMIANEIPEKTPDNIQAIGEITGKFVSEFNPAITIAANQATRLLAAMRELGSIDIGDIDIGFTTSFAVPLGGDIVTPGGSVGGAAGLSDYIVPPGYPNDSYGVRASSGEIINIQRPHQMRGGTASIDSASINRLSAAIGRSVRDAILQSV
jgi:hypothetical protein